MRSSNRRRWLSLLVLAGLLVPGVAAAEDPASLRKELDTMRQQFETMKQQYETRMQELSERLQKIETQKAAAPAPASASAAPAPTAVAQQQPPTAPGPATPPSPLAPASASLMQLLTPHQPFAFAGPGRVLLFDIGVAGDFVTDFTSNKAERLRDGTFNGRENRLFARHEELILAGRVDPFASAIVRLVAAEGPPGPGGRETEENVTLEEANGTLLTLPLGTTLRFGRMRPRFGTLNMVDEDDLPQVDRPDVLRRLFGEEEMNTEKGAEAFWLLPTPFYEELSLGVFNGDNETAFGRGSLRDPLVLSRLRSFFELGDAGGLQVDLSAGTGQTSQDRRNTIAGLGLKYKWFPPAGYPFPMITLAAEGVYGDRDVRVADLLGNVSTRNNDAWGYYMYGQYDWTKRWAAGLRYDWTQLPTAPGHEQAVGPYLQFKPSEFLRFRAQYKRTEGASPLVRDADEVFLQGSFIMGVHPTERF